VNETLRRGLNPPRQPRRTTPFRVKARKMILREGITIESIEQLLDQVDGPSRK
jgi:hypothetical protein